ncbi:MAG: hypothetical protein H0X37_04275 [Herpetosiphonaceae bacterium]|nr:hypothetical protein [Herpetosiphonaceae bacterium]
MTDMPFRPRDLALLLLASGHLLPRDRARDQQADVAGMSLKREVLERLSVLDPEPAALDATLLEIMQAIGEPTGPTRGVCLDIRADWEAALASTEFAPWLLNQAIREGEGRRGGKRRGQQPDE